MGVLVATSIIQGGPSCPIFAPGVYTYISEGKYLGVMDGEVPDPNVQNLLDQVRN